MIQSRAVRCYWQQLLLVAFVVTFSGLVLAADGKVVPRKGGAEDHPLGLVAFASLDRLRARMASVGEAVAYEEGDKLLFAFLGNDESIVKFCTSPGIDPTRPFGAMSYPNWFAAAEVPEVQGAEPAEPMEAPELSLNGLADPDELLESLAGLMVENATLVICIPVKDREQLLASLRELMQHQRDNLIEVESQPGWYTASKDTDTRLGFVGTYLMVVAHEGRVKNFDRNYPDFGRLARTSLGKNGFVYSLYRKGLPALVRDGLAPAFKLAYEAQFQRQDNEPELNFRLRTMFGSLQIELLDMMISHVDEFRIAGHVDSRTRTIHVEPELVGPRDGKFAKFCNGIVGKSNPFASLAADDAIFAVTTSFPLPQKAWKPVADALHGHAQLISHAETAAVVRVIARTIESGQIDLYAHSPTSHDGLFAVKVAGGSAFPEQLQQLIATLSQPPLFQLGADSIEGFPVHRTLTTVDSPHLMFLSLVFSGLTGQAPDLPALNQTEIEINGSVGEEVTPDGTKRIVRRSGQNVPAKNALWLVATPQAIWLAVGSARDESCPEWFRSQVAASLAKPTGAMANARNKSPVQLMVRGLGASDPANSIQQVGTTDPPAKEDSPGEVKAQERGDLLRDLPNAIRLELRPTDTGMKFALSFEEAYFRWFAAYIKHSIEENEAAAKNPAPPVIESPAVESPEKR